MKEEFKDIKGYEGLYQVSNLGRVKSLKRMVVRNNNRPQLVEEKILKPNIDKDGYLLICLYKNGKQKFFTIHRLVAKAFILNPNNLPQVNHKNEIKDDNRAENLEWCTVKYNNIYNGRQKRIAEKISKSVLQIGIKTNEIIAEFPSIKEAERQLGFRKSHISECCKGKRNTVGGFKWAFKKEDY